MAKTILIVDDSDFERSLLRDILIRRGDFEVIEANSSEACLEALKAKNIDLVLLDIMMPGVDGTATLRLIRQEFNLIELPVIMVTAKADASDVVDSLRADANDYITKPVNFEIALSRVKTHLKLAELSKEMTRLKETESINAMVTTYNHEINNPLTIALGCIDDVVESSKAREKVTQSLMRISEIVKKIREVSERREIEKSAYTGSGTMLKLK